MTENTVPFSKLLSSSVSFLVINYDISDPALLKEVMTQTYYPLKIGTKNKSDSGSKIMNIGP